MLYETLYVGKLIIDYYNINELNFDLSLTIENYIKPINTINKNNTTIINTITKEPIIYNQNNFKQYKHTFLNYVQYKHNFLTNEYYAVRVYDIKTDVYLKYKIIDIYSLQNNQLIANFIFDDDYNKQNYLQNHEKQNISSIRINVNNNTKENYMCMLCNNKLIRVKLNINNYRVGSFKTIPILFKPHINVDKKSIVYNFITKKKKTIPFYLRETINDLYCVYVIYNIFALIDPFNYKMYMQLISDELNYKLLTKVII
jgi:hypothetical protein